MAIGRPGIAKIITESARRMGGSPSLDRNQRNLVLEKLKPDFEDLDNAFYKLDGELDIEGSLVAYIRKCPSEFTFSGTVIKP